MRRCRGEEVEGGDPACQCGPVLETSIWGPGFKFTLLFNIFPFFNPE
jgi:hypothetical protein